MDSSAIGIAVFASLGFAVGSALAWLGTRRSWQRRLRAAIDKQARLSAQLGLEQNRGASLAEQVRALQNDLKSRGDRPGAKASPPAAPPDAALARVHAMNDLFIAADRPNPSGFEDTQVMMGDPRAMLAEEATRR